MSFAQAYQRYWNNISTLRAFFTNLYPYTDKHEKEEIDRMTVELNDFGQQLKTLKEERQKEAGVPHAQPAAINEESRLASRFTKSLIQTTQQIRHPQLLNRGILVLLGRTLRGTTK